MLLDLWFIRICNFISSIARVRVMGIHCTVISSNQLIRSTVIRPFTSFSGVIAIVTFGCHHLLRPWVFEHRFSSSKRYWYFT